MLDGDNLRISKISAKSLFQTMKKTIFKKFTKYFIWQKILTFIFRKSEVSGQIYLRAVLVVQLVDDHRVLAVLHQRDHLVEGLPRRRILALDERWEDDGRVEVGEEGGLQHYEDDERQVAWTQVGGGRRSSQFHGKSTRRNPKLNFEPGQTFWLDQEIWSNESKRSIFVIGNQ